MQGQIQPRFTAGSQITNLVQDAPEVCRAAFGWNLLDQGIAHAVEAHGVSLAGGEVGQRAG